MKQSIQSFDGAVAELLSTLSPEQSAELSDLAMNSREVRTRFWIDHLIQHFTLDQSSVLVEDIHGNFPDLAAMKELDGGPGVFEAKMILHEARERIRHNT